MSQRVTFLFCLFFGAKCVYNPREKTTNFLKILTEAVNRILLSTVILILYLHGTARALVEEKAVVPKVIVKTNLDLGNIQRRKDPNLFETCHPL